MHTTQVGQLVVIHNGDWSGEAEIRKIDSLSIAVLSKIDSLSIAVLTVSGLDLHALCLKVAADELANLAEYEADRVMGKRRKKL